MNRAVLTRPFPPEEIKQRQGQHGKTLSYVAASAVIARLNEGCERWDFQVERYEILDEEVVVLGRLIVEGTVTKSAFGSSAITRDRDRRVVSIGNDLKSAASDALKKSASLLGVGLELYGGAKTTESKGSTDERPRPRPTPASPAPGDRITARQLSALLETARRKGMGGPRLAALLVERCGRAEAAHLTKREASEIIGLLSSERGAAA